MTDKTSLTNQLLIAMPSLEDPNFGQSVTYICEHNEDGAMGLIINRPMELGLGEVLNQLEIDCVDTDIANQVVYFGGPVETERGFILHEPVGDWESTLAVTDTLGVTSSRDILEAIGQGVGPRRMLITLGYASWTAGQLEQELADNAWFSGPADADLIFDLPIAERWEAAARLIGVDLTMMSNDIGHA